MGPPPQAGKGLTCDSGCKIYFSRAYQNTWTLCLYSVSYRHFRNKLRNIFCLNEEVWAFVIGWSRRNKTFRKKILNFITNIAKNDRSQREANQSLKCQMFIVLGYKDRGTSKFKFVANTQFLSIIQSVFCLYHIIILIFTILTFLNSVVQDERFIPIFYISWRNKM